MSQAGKRTITRTVSTRDFTGAIAQNAAAFLSLDVKGLGVGSRVDCLLRSVTVVSVEDLDWELWFFTKTGVAGNSADPDVNTLIGRVVLPSTALQIGATGLFTFYSEGLEINIFDDDNTSKIHMALVERAAAGKTAGAAGGVKITLALEQTLSV